MMKIELYLTRGGRITATTNFDVVLIYYEVCLEKTNLELKKMTGEITAVKKELTSFRQEIVILIMKAEMN